MSTNYEVTAEREGKWWVFRIPELDTSGQARSLAEVEDEARGIISAWNEVSMEDVAATVTVEGIDAALAEWKAADEDDRRAREAAAAAAKRRRGVIVQLRTIGYSGADVAKVVGVSKQRVSQLAKVSSGAASTVKQSAGRGTKSKGSAGRVVKESVGGGIKPTIKVTTKVATGGKAKANKG